MYEILPITNHSLSHSYGYNTAGYYQQPPAPAAGAPPASAPAGTTPGYGTTAPYGSYSSSNTTAPSYGSYGNSPNYAWVYPRSISPPTYPFPSDSKPPAPSGYYSQAPPANGSAPPSGPPSQAPPPATYSTPSYQGYPPGPPPQQQPPPASGYGSYAPPPQAGGPPPPSNGSSWGQSPGGYGAPPPRNGNSGGYGGGYGDRGDYRYVFIHFHILFLGLCFLSSVHNAVDWSSSIKFIWEVIRILVWESQKIGSSVFPKKRSTF